MIILDLSGLEILINDDSSSVALQILESFQGTFEKFMAIVYQV